MKKLFLMIIVIYSISWYVPDISASDTLWDVAYYANAFGESTQDKYIRNIRPIHGAFSNSATQDSLLNVRFLIDERLIAIQLYEYAGNNPVKAYGDTTYTVLFRDKDGHCEKFSLYLRSDRIVFPQTIYYSGLHNALMKGGNIKFVIQEDKYPINIYRFTIKSKVPLPETENYVQSYRQEIGMGTYAKAYKQLLLEK
jgi:hypothetical protein